MKFVEASRSALRSIVHSALRRTGRALTRVPVDIEEDFWPLLERCRKASMLSVESLYCLYSATGYVVRNDVPGDLAICGVWRGGGAMMCALSLLRMGSNERALYLYDTFAGMTRPGERDVHGLTGEAAIDVWSRGQRPGGNEWAYAPLEEARANLTSTGYPSDLLEFVPGPIEETLPATAPKQVALMHLDTDWYSSTKHELTHLYPRLSRGGILIVDDYGGWQGARAAVDEYFETADFRPFLARTDWSGRVLVKP